MNTRQGVDFKGIDESDNDDGAKDFINLEDDIKEEYNDFDGIDNPQEKQERDFDNIDEGHGEGGFEGG